VLANLVKVRALLEKLDAEMNSDSIDWRRDFITVDLGLAAVKGMIVDGVVLPPYDFFKLDTLDFRAWLSKHGAHDISVNSAYISGMYDLGFSLPGQVGAGTALNGILRMCWTYKGAVMWKMQAGMGDTIFGPLYLALRQRGVKFEFFRRVDKLEVDRDTISKVIIGRQVTVAAGAQAYDPLVDVKGLPCWPSEPRYDQLVQGDALKKSGEDLEDWWTAWPDPEPPQELVKGRDFDAVILGASVAMFPYIAKDVMDASGPFRDMVETLGTTQTQAGQLWLQPDLAGLGWTLQSPVLDGYAEPMDTWADMTHLLPRESWPPGETPGSLAYLCSPLPDDGPLPPRSEHGYAQKQMARVATNLDGWITQWATGLWPKFQRSQIMDRYSIATWNPSDRYVLALPNTVDKRLGTQGAGIGNLYLAGDYLRTGMNVGCVEAATMGGMHASRAICGRPEVIVGDDTTNPPRPPHPNGKATYISRGGDLVMAAPLQLRGATMYSFLLDADLATLQRLVDSQLNAVAGPGTYSPLGAFVSVVCADITDSYSTYPPDRAKGWMSERDFGVWVPVVRDGKIGWYLPYVFVDNVAAMLTGREVFGFFKQQAVLAMPPNPRAPGMFSIDALAIPQFAASSQAENVRLLTMTAVGGAMAAPAGSWGSLREAAEAVKASTNALHTGMSWWQLAKNVVEMLATGDVPMVFLKQFRDVRSPDQACYQAVIEAPSHLDHWYDGWFASPHDITIAPCDSHPIAAECGLGAGPWRSNVGFWCRMDFTMETGTVIAGGRSA
jgi:uncharacterized protein with NAD-binding domain and iron-sulfur cluster